MVLGFIIHYIKANSYVSENNQHSNAHIRLTKVEYLMFQGQIIDTYKVFLFSKFTFPQLVSKLKLKLKSFVLFLKRLHERFKNVL